MRLSELDYELPLERIAQWPLPERDASRMLVLERKTDRWEDRGFRELPDVVRGDELVVLNNARVLLARLFGRRAGIRAERPGRRGPTHCEFLQSPIEVLLLRQIELGVWEALVRPGRKVRTGEKIIFGDNELEAQVRGRDAYGLRTLHFSAAGDLRQTIERLGRVPLPPYIKRPDEPQDRVRYQTVYAQRGTAIAAPTAGLHFTQEILERLRARGIEICELTLEVGLGTFEPVRTELLEDHIVHSEAYEIPEDAVLAIDRARRENRPILAVGTTVVRALEDAAERAAGQGSGAATGAPACIAPGTAEARIFIYPGRKFRVVDQLLTNFHLPRSSLLALVAAFAGRDLILQAYRHAIDERYRFYSYGDCMLIR